MLSMMRPQILHCLTSLAPKADARESPSFYDLELESEPVTTLGLTSKAVFYRTMPKVGLRAAPMVLACRSLNTAASSNRPARPSLLRHEEPCAEGAAET